MLCHVFTNSGVYCPGFVGSTLYLTYVFRCLLSRVCWIYPIFNLRVLVFISILFIHTGFLVLFPGFCSYLGMLRIEVNHNHPILRTFCQMLIDHMSAHAPRTARSSEPRANHVIDPETPKTSVEEMSLSEYHGGKQGH